MRAHLAAEAASQSTHGDQSNLDEVRDAFNSMPRYQMPLDSKFKTPIDVTINTGGTEKGPIDVQLRVDGHVPHSVAQDLRSQMQWSKQQHGRPMIGSMSGYGTIQSQLQSGKIP